MINVLILKVMEMIKNKQLWKYLHSIDYSYYRMNVPGVIRSMDFRGFLSKRYNYD